jgi:hypothetical protein
MEIQSWHCDPLQITVLGPIPGAVAFGADQFGEQRIGRPLTFDKALYVLAAVEPGDDRASVKNASRRLRAIARHCGVVSIVVNGYAHLAYELAPPATAYRVLQELATRLESTAEWDVDLLPFGFDKTWLPRVLPGPWAQRGIHTLARSPLTREPQPDSASLDPMPPPERATPSPVGVGAP